MQNIMSHCELLPLEENSCISVGWFIIITNTNHFEWAQLVVENRLKMNQSTVSIVQHNTALYVSVLQNIPLLKNNHVKGMSGDCQ